MPIEYVLWFDARCSTSRRALELLRDRGVDPVVRRHLEDPPTAAEIEAVLAALGLPAHEVVRTDEDEYQALRLSPRTPAPDLVRAIAAHPRILDRPILLAGGRGLIARPAERVLELLGTPSPDRAG